MGGPQVQEASEILGDPDKRRVRSIIIGCYVNLTSSPIGI